MWKLFTWNIIVIVKLDANWWMSQNLILFAAVADIWTSAHSENSLKSQRSIILWQNGPSARHVSRKPIHPCKLTHCAHRYTQIHKYTNAQICKYTNVQICIYTNTQPHKLNCEHSMAKQARRAVLCWFPETDSKQRLAQSSLTLNTQSGENSNKGKYPFLPIKQDGEA